MCTLCAGRGKELIGGVSETCRGKADPFSWRWGNCKRPDPSPAGSSGAGISWAHFDKGEQVCLSPWPQQQHPAGQHWHLGSGVSSVTPASRAGLTKTPLGLGMDCQSSLCHSGRWHYKNASCMWFPNQCVLVVVVGRQGLRCTLCTWHSLALWLSSVLP